MKSRKKEGENNNEEPAEEQNYPAGSYIQPSKIVKSRKKEAESYDEEIKRQINPQDIAVNAN